MAATVPKWNNNVSLGLKFNMFLSWIGLLAGPDLGWWGPMGAQYGGALFCSGFFVFVEAQSPTGTTPMPRVITRHTDSYNTGKGVNGNV